MRSSLQVEVRLLGSEHSSASEPSSSRRPTTLYVFRGAEKQHVNSPAWGESYNFRLSRPPEGEDAEVDVVLHFDHGDSFARSFPLTSASTLVVLISRAGDVTLGE